MKKKLFGAMLIIGFILVLAACAGGGDSVSLDGTSWILSTLGGAAPIPGTTITLNFADGQVSGSACNHYGGDYQVKGDKITLGAMFMTEMYCEPEEVNTQEAAYLEMLGSAQTVKIEGGRLIITTAGGEQLTFDPAN